MTIGLGTVIPARAWRWARRGLGVLALTVLQVALVLAAGAVVATPAAAIAVGLAASVALVLPFTLLRVRKRRDIRHRVMLAGVSVAVSSALTLLVVLPSTPAPVVVPAGALRLEDGTFLAMRTVGADAASGAVPIVAVHGGPGVPWTEREQEVLERLAADRDLVLYDQIGTGASARLDDPRGYTYGRAVSDLEAVIDATSTDRVTLLGYSWGATVALGYAVRHPDRVDRLVFLSPGAFPWDGVAQPPGSPQRRLSPGEKASLYALALQPRNLFIYSMTLTDVGIAHRFAPDAEADARYRDLYLASAPGLVCDGHEVPDAPDRLGHYANFFPGVEPGHRTGVTPAAVARLDAHPVLVLRGECDYLDADIADEYVRELPQVQLADVADAGHALLEEQPDELIGGIEAFLADEATAEASDTDE